MTQTCNCKPHKIQLSYGAKPLSLPWLRNVSLLFAMQVGVIGIGVWVDSAAMQWMGFVILLVFLVAAGFAVVQPSLTFDEARAEIDRLEKL